MAQQYTRTVRSMAEVTAAIQELNIQPAEAARLQFEVHEQTSLLDAVKLKARTRAGRQGYKVLNSEFLDCKLDANIAIEEVYKSMYRSSTVRIDDALRTVEAAIAQVMVCKQRPDDQIPNVGPPVEHRNRGVEHMIFPHPLYSRNPSFPYGNGNQRPLYQEAYAQPGVDAAVARDKRAQRAIWDAMLRFYEVRKDVLENSKSEMERRMKAVYDSLTEEPTNLGSGYANFDDPPLA
ncbi:unnamed protein product [Urochloa decumbens]|uniref:Uncharacterized protein n=1 Tax=Urochloa decumbens TaxID=240449 RepID=A0ABC8W5Z2_9POAL